MNNNNKYLSINSKIKMKAMIPFKIKMQQSVLVRFFFVMIYFAKITINKKIKKFMLLINKETFM